MKKENIIIGIIILILILIIALIMIYAPVIILKEDEGVTYIPIEDIPIEEEPKDSNYENWMDCLKPCSNETKNCTEFMECSKICDLQFGFAPDRSCATFQRYTKYINVTEEPEEPLNCSLDYRCLTGG